MAQRETQDTHPTLGPTVTPSGISPPGSPPPPSLPVDHINSEAKRLRFWIASFANNDRSAFSGFTITVSRDRFSAQTPASGRDYVSERPTARGMVWWLRAVDTLQQCFQAASVPVAELSVTVDFLGLLSPAEESNTIKTDEWPAVEQLVLQCGSAVDLFVWPVDANQLPVHFRGVSRLAIALSTHDTIVQTSDFAEGLMCWTRDFIATGAVGNSLAELQFRNVEKRVAGEFDRLAPDPSWGKCEIEDIRPLQDEEEEGETPLTGRVHVTFRIRGAA